MYFCIFLSFQVGSDSISSILISQKKSIEGVFQSLEVYMIHEKEEKRWKIIKLTDDLHYPYVEKTA